MIDLDGAIFVLAFNCPELDPVMTATVVIREAGTQYSVGASVRSYPSRERDLGTSGDWTASSGVVVIVGSAQGEVTIPQRCAGKSTVSYRSHERVVVCERKHLARAAAGTVSTGAAVYR